MTGQDFDRSRRLTYSMYARLTPHTCMIIGTCSYVTKLQLSLPSNASYMYYLN